MSNDSQNERFLALEQWVRSSTGRGRWLVLTHDNPDPDSIAAADALALLLRHTFRRPATIAYGGIIGRAENREMVRLLKIRMSPIRRLNWAHYKHFALVDTQPGTGNNQLPADVRPDLVIDHHPVRRATYLAQIHDIRPSYGASATILGEYLLASGTPISKMLATALAYAIRTETQEFAREFSPPDRNLYDHLMPLIDRRALARIQSPRLPFDYFRTLHLALERLEGVHTLIVSHLDYVEQPDIIPEIADLLLRLEGRTWSLCSGVYEDRVYLSIRTTNPRGNAGEVMRKLLGRRGKGGGHGMMAGGWLPLPQTDRPTALRALQNGLSERLARALRKDPTKLRPITVADPSAEPTPEPEQIATPDQAEELK